MLAHAVYFSVFWLNSFPPKGGIATHVSPRTIIIGLTINFSVHCQLEFGSYVQTHEAHNNNMNPRTIGAICLGPKGNIQGGHNFMSLSTGERIRRRQWTPLPMPEEVIERVHKLAQRAPYGLTFDNDKGDISEVDGYSINGDDGDDYEHMNPFNFNNNQNINEEDGEDDQLPANQVDSEKDFEFNEDHLDNHPNTSFDQEARQDQTEQEVVENEDDEIAGVDPNTPSSMFHLRDKETRKTQ
jgi:hypothetical protein